MSTKRANADVLLVLDRSESMTSILTSDTQRQAGATNCSLRLAAVVAGVNSVVSNNPDIHWGLELFVSPASSSTCVVSGTPQEKTQSSIGLSRNQDSLGGVRSRSSESAQQT
jgi:hypothetical protein